MGGGQCGNKKDFTEHNVKNANVVTKIIEGNKILGRKIYAEVPTRVEYELSSIGYLLKPVIIELENWVKKHKEIR